MRIAFVVLAVASVVSSDDAPYPPSGWKPEGARLTLPNEGSGQYGPPPSNGNPPPSNGYGPPPSNGNPPPSNGYGPPPSNGNPPPSNGYGPPPSNGNPPPSNGYGPPPSNGNPPPSNGYGPPPSNGYGPPPSNGNPPPSNGYGPPPSNGNPPPSNGYGPPPSNGNPPPSNGYGPPPSKDYGTPPNEYGPPNSVPQNQTDLEKASERLMESLRSVEGSDRGVYYVYLPDGRLQRVQYTTAPLRKNPPNTQQSSFHNNQQSNTQFVLGSHQVNTQVNGQTLPHQYHRTLEQEFARLQANNGNNLAPESGHPSSLFARYNAQQ